MANENLNMLNFKFGLHDNLPSSRTPGTVYITTDEQAMYVDLQATGATEASRIRIGDIIVKESARTAEPPFAEGAFYYFVAENALLRWSNGAWKQINSVSDVQGNIDDLTDKINNVVMPKFDEYLRLDGTSAMGADLDAGTHKIVNVAEPSALTDAATKNYVDTEAAKKVNIDDFEAFQEENTDAIEDAKKAGTDAAKSINEVVIPKFNDYLELAGTSAMKGTLKMGTNSITGVKDMPANATGDYATNKTYVDAQIATRVAASDFTAFQTTNSEAIAAAKKAGDDAAKNINEVVLPKFNNYLDLNGESAMAGSLKMGSNKITGLADPANLTDATNKQYVDSGLATKVNNDDFVDFQEENTKAIADAKKAGTDAGKKIDEVVLPKFNDYLDLSGEAAMKGALQMDNHKITGLADPSNPADAAHKKYVDDGLATKVNTSDFTTFQTGNSQLIAEAKKAGTDAAKKIDDVVLPKFENYLEISGGTLTGPIGLSNSKITDVAAPENGGDVTNKTYVDTEVGKKVNTSDFTAFQVTNSDAIALAKKSGDDAAKRIDEVVLPKFNNYLELAGGTMSGKITMSGDDAIVTGLKAPSAASDATNKKYVDDEVAKKVNTSDFTAFQGTNSTAIANAKKAGDDAAKRIDEVVLPKFAEYLTLVGGTMSGNINMGGSTVTGLAVPANDTDAATKKYVDDAIRGNDAMTFKGVIDSTHALPATADVGDTYKVGEAGTYGSIVAKVGDLIINAAENDSDTPVWMHISSGYEDNYLQKLVAIEDTIYLTDGVGTTESYAVAGLAFSGEASNIQFAVSSSAGENPVHTVTATMVWGEF